MKEILYPVDSANFKWIRENGFVYVDKTGYISSLTRQGKYFFLARPRRFGKSLFLDTLAEYFKGNRDLFKDLAIDRLQLEKWEKYPVLRINLSGVAYTEKSILKSTLNSLLQQYEDHYQIEIEKHGVESIYSRFEILIRKLKEKTGKNVVILIDEYDAPLSSTIGKPELQEIYREELHGFYSVLKKVEEYIQFCMLTGVTRYGKVSVFSGLNNLNDITFDDEFSGICGVTAEELKGFYNEGIIEFADKEKISPEEAYSLLKFHYDGYHFSSSMLDIYNPYSINYALSKKKIENYWCKSGVPTILSKSLMENDYDIQDLSNNLVEESMLSDLSIYTTNPLPLFYQTGYLTLKSYDPEDNLYTVGYPNREVERGILNNILSVYNPGNKGVTPAVSRLKRSLREGNPEEFIKILSSFLADIPSSLKKHVGKYENYYHTIFYCLVKLIGLDIDAEYNTSDGFIDILIKTTDYIYIIELKVNGTAEDAIKQIEERNYAAPFASDARRIYEIGIGFSKTTHQITSSIII